MILKEGVNHVRDKVSVLFERGQLGTGGTAVTYADTDLLVGDSSTTATLTVTTSDEQFTSSYTLVSTAGTTTTYYEFKDYDNTNSKDFSRIVMTGVSWTPNGNQELTVIKKYFIRGI